MINNKNNFTSKDVLDTIDCSNTSEAKQELLAKLVFLLAQVVEHQQKEDLTNQKLDLARKPFWDKKDIMEATGFSAKTVDEILSDPALNVNTLGKSRLVERKEFIEYFKNNPNRTTSAYWRKVDKFNSTKRK